jgi:hypothetical protein
LNASGSILIIVAELVIVIQLASSCVVGSRTYAFCQVTITVMPSWLVQNSTQTYRCAQNHAAIWQNNFAITLRSLLHFRQNINTHMHADVRGKSSTTGWRQIVVL